MTMYRETHTIVADIANALYRPYLCPTWEAEASADRIDAAAYAVATGTRDTAFLLDVMRDSAKRSGLAAFLRITPMVAELIEVHTNIHTACPLAIYKYNEDK